MSSRFQEVWDRALPKVKGSLWTKWRMAPDGEEGSEVLGRLALRVLVSPTVLAESDPVQIVVWLAHRFASDVRHNRRGGLRKFLRPALGLSGVERREQEARPGSALGVLERVECVDLAERLIAGLESLTENQRSALLCSKFSGFWEVVNDRACLPGCVRGRSQKSLEQGRVGGRVRLRAWLGERVWSDLEALRGERAMAVGRRVWCHFAERYETAVSGA